MDTLTIRSAVAVDANVLAALELACAFTPMSALSLTDELRNPDRAYFLALDGMQAVGYAGVAILAGEGHIMTIGVVESHRRCGIAGQLMAVLTAWFDSREVTEVTLEVRVDNLAARALYASWGFVGAGLRPRYYADLHDAVIMWKRGA